MNHITLLFLVICAYGQKLIVSNPQELAEKIGGSNGTVVHPSPLGYKPKSGWLHGNI